jgi:hypothetical protein
MFRVTVLAMARKLVVAKEAVSAGDGKGYDDPISPLQIRHSFAYFFHDPHELVSQHHRAGLGDSAGINVQVGPADRRGRYFQNDIAIVFYRGVGDRIVSYFLWTMYYRCFHTILIEMVNLVSFLGVLVVSSFCRLTSAY